MWTLNLSKRDALTLIWIQMLVPVVALAIAWGLLGVNALGNEIAALATYERTEQGWHTDHAEDVVAAYTIWLVVVTSFLALFTAALFVATFALFNIAAKDGERTLKQARELFTAERRPWIQIEVLVAGSATEGKDNISLPVTFRMKNVGLSPALKVEMIAHSTRQDSEGIGYDEFESEMRFWRRHISKDIPGGFIFPGASFLNPHTLADIKIKKADGSREKKWFIRAWAQYTFAGSDGVHFTPVLAWLKIEPDYVSGNTIGRVEVGPCGIDLNPD